MMYPNTAATEVVLIKVTTESTHSVINILNPNCNKKKNQSESNAEVVFNQMSVKAEGFSEKF